MIPTIIKRFLSFFSILRDSYKKRSGVEYLKFQVIASLYFSYNVALYFKENELSEKKERIYVMIGIITNSQGQFCLSQRPDHVHLGGLWEFPGGKLEIGETPLEGLKRELHEELSIEVLSAKPFMRFPYDYPKTKVFLDFWLVDQFNNEPHGKEGQPVRWLNAEELTQYETPAASHPVIEALVKYARIPSNLQS